MIGSKDKKDIWYLVGLIATDGNLSIDGRHIDITAKNKVFLEIIKNKLGITNKVGQKYNSKGSKAHRIQISDVSFYKFLVSIGLSVNKSLTLGCIKVPDEYFSYFLRGIIDGDGDIHRWVHPTNKHEQWALRITTGSEKFANWLLKSIERIIAVKGRMYSRKDGKNILYKLKFGKIAAKIILNKCYLQGETTHLCLERKYILANDCVNSISKWKRSKTVVYANTEEAAGMLELVDNTDLKSVGA